MHEAGARHLADPSRLMASAARVFGPGARRAVRAPAAHRRRAHPRADRRRPGRPRGRPDARLVRLPRPRAPPRRAARLADRRPLHRRRRRACGRRRPATCGPRPRRRSSTSTRRLGSLERMRERSPTRLLFSHFGPVTDVGTTLDRSVEELRLWVELVREARARRPRPRPRRRPGARTDRSSGTPCGHVARDRGQARGAVEHRGGRARHLALPRPAGCAREQLSRSGSAALVAARPLPTEQLAEESARARRRCARLPVDLGALLGRAPLARHRPGPPPRSSVGRTRPPSPRSGCRRQPPRRPSGDRSPPRPRRTGPPSPRSDARTRPPSPRTAGRTPPPSRRRAGRTPPRDPRHRP